LLVVALVVGRRCGSFEGFGKTEPSRVQGASQPQPQRPGTRGRGSGEPQLRAEYVAMGADNLLADVRCLMTTGRFRPSY